MTPTFIVYDKDDWPLCVGGCEDVIQYLGTNYKNLYHMIWRTKYHSERNMKYRVYKYYDSEVAQ